MNKYIRQQPTISRHADEQNNDDHWFQRFQDSLQKGAVQPRPQESIFDQINSIMNRSKSKHSSVEAAVDDMKSRSGLTAYLDKINKQSQENVNEVGTKKTAAKWDNSEEAETYYYNLGLYDGKEDQENYGFGSDVLASILSHKKYIPLTHKPYHAYARGYFEGSHMKPDLQTKELWRIDNFLSKQHKKASDNNAVINKKVDVTPIVIKKHPAIQTTLENCIRDSKGNLSVPAIIHRLQAIHNGDVSDIKDWEDDKLTMLVSKLNLDAKSNNPDSFQSFHNLGRHDNVADHEIDPSNMDAFHALMPAKI